MTAPDYSKCWKCGKDADRYSRFSAVEDYYECNDETCKTWAYDRMWRSIHDRLAAVREEGKQEGILEERERACEIILRVKDATEQLARIRKGE